MGTLFDGYAAALRRRGHWPIPPDEMFADTAPRRRYRSVFRTLAAMSGTDLERRTDRPDVDPIPVVVSADEWARIERGVHQRLATINAVLADHGGRRAVADGVLPAPVTDRQHPATPVRTAAIELVRDEHCRLRIVDVAVGAAPPFDALADARATMHRVAADLFSRDDYHPIGPAPGPSGRSRTDAGPSDVAARAAYTYLPDLTHYYLGERPILDNVASWRLDEPVILEDVLDRLDRLVLRPLDPTGDDQVIVGPDTPPRRLSKIADRLRHDPRGWIAQAAIGPTTIPTLVDGAVRPGHVSVRVFATAVDDGMRLVPGGVATVIDPGRGRRRKDVLVARE